MSPKLLEKGIIFVLTSMSGADFDTQITHRQACLSTKSLEDDPALPIIFLMCVDKLLHDGNDAKFYEILAEFQIQA